MMKNNSDSNKSSGSHSFYKEANKSILGQQQMTPKKFGKLSFKVIKWMVFAFLIITTLWGCVNEFIIKTSNNLGQGVEFYQKNDFIYPNMYQATEVVGYTSSAVAVSSGTGYGIDEKKLSPETESFNFYVMNPNYGLDFNGLTIREDILNEYFPDAPDEFEPSISDVELILNVENLFIKSSDIKTFSINGSEGEITNISDAPKAYSYNLNEATVLLTGLYNYKILEIDSSDMNDETKGIYAFDTKVPKTILGIANNKTSIIDDEDFAYSVTSMKSLAFFLYDENDEKLDGIIDDLYFNPDPGKQESFFFNAYDGTDDNPNPSDDGYKYSEISGINGSVKPDDGLSVSATYNIPDPENDDETSGWEYNESDEMRLENFEFIFNDQAVVDDDNTYTDSESIIAMNQFLRKQVFLSGDLTGETTKSLLDSGAYVSILLAYGIENTSFIIPNFESLLPNNTTIYSGAQLVVMPIDKGFPVEASRDTQILIDGHDENNNSVMSNGHSFEKDDQLRSEGFGEINTSDSKMSGEGFDFETQMYGWMLMESRTNEDGTHNILRTYSTAEQAVGLNDDDDPITYTEDDYFYADQRREEWGAVAYGQTETNENEYSVFDEKIKIMMNESAENIGKNETNFLSLDRTITINGEMINYTTATTFAGMTSMEQVSVMDDSYIGVIPQTNSIKTGEGETAITTVYERSILSDSVIPTGQDSWGESRIAFIGWDDWGKAWGAEYGPMYGMFVFPLAQISMGIGEVFNYSNSAWGTLLSIFIIVFLTRGLGSLLSLKGTKNQMKMQEVQTDVAKIKAKYSKYDFKQEPKMKQKQQQEIMALYRKNDVSPMGSLGTIFITMPIFISLWIIISSLPAYKLVIMGNFSWAISAWSGIFGGYGFGILLLYLLVGLSVGLVQGVSSKLPNWLANKRKGIKRVDAATKESMKKQNRTQNIMVGVFVFMGLTVPALFAFYWIASGSFTIVLELSRHGWRTHTAKEIKLNPIYKTPTEKMATSIKSVFHK